MCPNLGGHQSLCENSIILPGKQDIALFFQKAVVFDLWEIMLYAIELYQFSNRKHVGVHSGIFRDQDRNRIESGLKPQTLTLTDPPDLIPAFQLISV